MAKYPNPNEYTKLGILSIPAGDHRVKIINVTKKIYGSSGKEGFEITLRVSGRRGLLWYWLVRDPDDEVRFYKKLQSFFWSFDILDQDISHYEQWIGKYGAVRVRHSVDEETKYIKAYVFYCLYGVQKDVLPAFYDITEMKTKKMEFNINETNK